MQSRSSSGAESRLLQQLGELTEYLVFQKPCDLTCGYRVPSTEKVIVCISPTEYTPRSNTGALIESTPGLRITVNMVVPGMGKTRGLPRTRACIASAGPG